MEEQAFLQLVRERAAAEKRRARRRKYALAAVAVAAVAAIPAVIWGSRAGKPALPQSDAIVPGTVPAAVSEPSAGEAENRASHPASQRPEEQEDPSCAGRAAAYFAAVRAETGESYAFETKEDLIASLLASTPGLGERFADRTDAETILLRSVTDGAAALPNETASSLGGKPLVFADPALADALLITIMTVTAREDSLPLTESPALTGEARGLTLSDGATYWLVPGENRLIVPARGLEWTLTDAETLRLLLLTEAPLATLTGTEE